MIADRQGLIVCSRYSFAPNSFHYCGPERQNDMLGYVTNSQSDDGLVEILNGFETLYPYLMLIASENNIKDPFDVRVVEAYWLGNAFLAKVKVRPFAEHLTDRMDLKRKLDSKKFTPMLDHIMTTGVPQHNFHVLNIFVRTGHHAVPHTLSTMDQCRISWGKVVEVAKQCIVLVKPLMYQKDKLMLGKPEQRIVTSIAVKPKKGDWVSIHWGYVCEILTNQKRVNLMLYTQKAVTAANNNQATRGI